MYRVIMAVLAVAAATTTPGYAQGATDPALDSAVTRIERVISGQSLARLFTPWGEFDYAEPSMANGHIRGQLLNNRLFLPDSLNFNGSVPVAWISQVQVRRSNVGRTMLTIGAALGIAGFLIGTVASDERNDSVQPLTVAAVAGGFGLLVGAVGGAATSHWETVYRR